MKINSFHRTFITPEADIYKDHIFKIDSGEIFKISTDFSKLNWEASGDELLAELFVWNNCVGWIHITTCDSKQTLEALQATEDCLVEVACEMFSDNAKQF